MKAWAMTLILTALIAGASALLLPKGENSPFYKSVKFLTSMILLLILCQPFLSFIRDPDRLSDSSFAKADETLSYDPGAWLLQRSEEIITRNVKEAFPEDDYKLVFDTDEEGHAITGIRIQTDDKELGMEISDWLVDNGLARF